MRLPFGLELLVQESRAGERAPGEPVPAFDGQGWFARCCTIPSWVRGSRTWWFNRDAVLAQATVFACITLIASDIAKLRLRVVQRYGRVWVEKTTPGYSDLLSKPNHFQTRQLFVEQWIISKLSTGNVYVLKIRNRKGMVIAMFVLDPLRVTLLVAPDGAV